MKNNAFTDIVLNWKNLSKTKKLQRLQDLENMMARHHGRKPRIVTTRVDSEFIGEERDAIAFYNRNNKSRLYILSLDMSGMDAARAIVHEGFHAYIDDFISGKVETLRTYSPVDAERFFIEEENHQAIVSEFCMTGRLPLYDSLYIEERINHKENSLTLIKMILDSIDSVKDSLRLQADFILALVHHASNERRGKKYERQYGITYDDMVVNALNKEELKKEPIVKTGKFVCEGDQEFLKFFDEATNLFMEYARISESPLMLPAAKEVASQKSLEKLSALYKEYIMQTLSAKKKN